MTSKTLITTYLEMTSPEQFTPGWIDAAVTIMQMTQPDLAFYRFLYQAVGEKWRWRDRLVMDDDSLLGVLSNPGVSIFTLYVGGAPAGYIELADGNGDVEMAYFGLREAFIGRGLGKHLLSYGVQSAWDSGAKRIWLHTCNLDGPYALANYRARGFTVYDVVEEPMPTIYL